MRKFVTRRRVFRQDPGLVLSIEPGGGVLKDGIFSSALTQTYAGTNRTRTNSAGDNEAVAANTPVIDYVNGQPSLRLEPAAMQLLFGSNTFTAAAGWTLSNVTTVDNGDGTWTVTDASASLGYFLHSIDKSASDSTTYFLQSMFIKKTTGATTFPGFGVQFSGVDGKYAQYVVNSNTGAVTKRGLASAGNVGYLVESKGDYWKVTAYGQDNGANTAILFVFVPAANADMSDTWSATAQGSAIIQNAMLTTGAIPSSYFTGAAAIGAEQATGTTTIGKVYLITATEVNHFGTGLIVGQYFISATEIALDANNKVKEHGTVRLTEANTTILAISDALNAALTGGDLTLVAWVRPGYAEAATSTDSEWISSGAAASLIYHDVSGNGVAAHDGTTEATVASAFAANTWYKMALSVNSTTSKFKIGIEAEGSTFDSASWGTEQDYDGDFPATGLIFGRVLNGPVHLGPIKAFDRVVSDNLINSVSR